MRIRFLLAAAAPALAASGVAALVFACGDDTPAITTTNDAGDGDSGAVDAGSTEDASQVAPNGCILRTTGYFQGKKADNVPRGDVTTGVNWTNPSGALATDGEFASVTLQAGQESASLRVGDFDFTIPEGAETWGIEFELKRRSPDSGVKDARIEVEIEGESPRHKFIDAGWPSSIVGTHPYGQAVDTWGVNLFPRHLNADTFAAKVSVKRESGITGPVTGLVDSIKIAVWYCPNPPP